MRIDPLLTRNGQHAFMGARGIGAFTPRQKKFLKHAYHKRLRQTTHSEDKRFER